MKTFSPQAVKRLIQVFKFTNALMLPMWRLGLRKWINICPPVLGRIMVMTHIGRRTGLRRRTPVNYTIVNDQVYCMAGLGKKADWYRNMMKNPSVEIWLPYSWWAGVAEEVLDRQGSLPIMRKLIKDTGIVGPLFGLNAYTMSDEQLFAATKNYLLVRIERTGRLRGRGGPGDLAWLWLIPAALIMIAYLM